MSSTMTAAVAHRDARHFAIESVEIPDVGDTDVLIRIMSAGINTGTLFNWRVLKRQQFPTIIGIHGAGIVEEVGAHVTGLAVGDHVRVDPVLSCGRCDYCCADQHLLCPYGCVMGFETTPAAQELFDRYRYGTLAQYWRVPHTTIEKLPDSMSFDVACKLGTLGVSYAALRLTEPRRRSTIVITGATGASGVAAVVCAPLFGIERVVAVGRSQSSLDEVAKLVPGLVETVALESLPEDWEETGALTDAIRDAAGSTPAQGLIDFMPGNATALRQTLYGVKQGGTAVLAAGNPGRIELDYVRTMPNGQYHLTGLRGHSRRDMLDLHEYLATGEVVVDELVTHTYPLERINDAVDYLDARPSGGRSWWFVINPH